jgi:hypothetical protein
MVSIVPLSPSSDERLAEMAETATAPDSETELREEPVNPGERNAMELKLTEQEAAAIINALLDAAKKRNDHAIEDAVLLKISDSAK